MSDKMRYFVDSFGTLWCGPFVNNDGEPYDGRFVGVVNGFATWESGTIKDAEEVTAAKANEIIQRFRDEEIGQAFNKRLAELKGRK